VTHLPIKPAARDFRELFSRKTFRVPPYQRAYDWKEEQVSDFARDIDAIVDARMNGGASPHFFGAVISIFDQETEFEVVDGQQRLTTHMLCLKELRDRWSELAEATRGKNKSVHRRAREQAEEVHKVIFTRNEPRLVLSRRDKDFFADILMGAATGVRRGDHQSHRRLWNACNSLREELFDPLLAGVSQFTKRQQRLQAVQDALLEDSYVVHLNTSDGDQAYRFFMVLNDRGKPLSAGDLLRTFTLAVLEEFPAQQQAAERDWDAILRRNESFVNRFLGAYYISHVGSRVPTGEMYDRFRKRFLEEPVDSPETATRLRETIAELRAEVETFAFITDGDWPFDEANKPLWEQDRLRRLVKSLGHRLADPLLLVVARETDETTFRDLVRMIEPFAFRYINIVNASASRLEALYFRHAKVVRNSGRLEKQAFRKELRELLNTYAPDEAFLALLPEQLRFSNKTTSKRLIKHFLTTLEDYEAWFKDGASGRPRKLNDRTTIRDLDTVNIEHIYPQNPPKLNPLLEPLKNTLGNLTALDQDEGRIAGNDEFLDKKPIYARSEFKITKPLGRVRAWNEAALVKRVNFYKRRAAKIFVVS
jgi:Protein of unknown function DUF262/Protein of unknown function (DUF1524)